MRSTIKIILLLFVFLIGTGDYTISAQNPPPHAKAHGVKKKYKYYPEANVYFNPITKRYTYLNGGKWSTVVTLPTSIRLIGNGNDFDFDGDDPWKNNATHKSQYKVNKSTKTYNKTVKNIDKNVKIDNNKGNGKKK